MCDSTSSWLHEGGNVWSGPWRMTKVWNQENRAGVIRGGIALGDVWGIASKHPWME